jgi:hypothetical protein
MWSPDDPSNRMPMVWKDLEPYENPEVKFNQEQFDFYQRAIALRHASPALRAGFFRPMEMNDANGTYAFARELDDQRVYVALNRSDKPQTLKIKIDADGEYFDWLDAANTEVKPPANGVDRPTIALKSDAKSLKSNAGELTITLQPFTTAALSKSK